MTKPKGEQRETAEAKAMRLLEQQMDQLRERVRVVETKARAHAPHLPEGETRLYVSYVRTLADRLIAAFEVGAPIPYFGSTPVDDDE